MSGSHERFDRTESAIRGSDRAFGITIAVVLAIVGGAKLWFGSSYPVVWLGVSIAFLAASLVRPQLLAPLNRLWFRFGLLLHRVVSPLMMALIFFGAVTPIAALMRLLGRRPIPMSFDRKAPSYWLPRADRIARRGSMIKQY